jgi:hypothetical protein
VNGDQFRGADAEGLLTDARMILQMLGFDPDAHRLAPVLRPWRGVQVVDRDGRPVRFFTEKAPRRRDPR